MVRLVVASGEWLLPCAILKVLWQMVTTVCLVLCVSVSIGLCSVLGLRVAIVCCLVVVCVLRIVL